MGELLNSARSEASGEESDRAGPVILLGLGFTTSRLARRLLIRGRPVYAVARNVGRFVHLAAAGLRISPFSQPELPIAATLVHTIPPLTDAGATDALRQFVLSLEPRRIVYISATSVYGEQSTVTAASPVHIPGDPEGSDSPDKESDKSRRRIEEERWIAGGPWSTLIVRPAAIYGPGRGAHVRIREGKVARGTGVVSRIHVDDLAAILEAGIFSNLEGAWPLADDYPCPSEEITSWCARLLRLPANPDLPQTFPVAGRTVDGTALRTLLKVTLAYPSYQSGILASIAEENSL